MKTFLLLILSFLFYLNVSSQTTGLTQKIRKSLHKNIINEKTITKTSKEYISTHKSINRRGSIEENINAIDYVSTFLGSSPYMAYTDPIFPDSNVIVLLSSGDSTPWLHGICQTFDLDGGYLKTSGGVFDPFVQPFDKDYNTLIDSIWIQGYYSRPDTNTVDTAIVTIIAKGHGNYTRAYNIGRLDSLIYVVNDVGRDNAPDFAVWTGKIILNSTFKKDTLPNGGNMFNIAPNINVSNYDGVIGVSLGFKPGNTYSQSNDTIYKNQNYIKAVYATPQGQNTAFPLGASPDDVTCGAFCNDNTKYSTTGFDYYLPPIAFTTDHPYQLYDITIGVYQFGWISVKELDNGAKLFQNYPNPTNGNTTINYSLENSANVSFEMMDITGKVVLASNEGNKTSGIHSLEVNTSKLTAGIYFYSLIVNNNRITKKMSLTK